jgi:hypothetical protein
MKYAAKTPVPVERSRAELEKIIRGFEATRFGVQWDKEAATVAFEYDRWRVRFTIRVPLMEEFALNAGGQRRNPIQQKAAHALEERRRWRSLVLVIARAPSHCCKAPLRFDRNLVGLTVGGLWLRGWDVHHLLNQKVLDLEKRVAELEKGNKP